MVTKIEIYLDCISNISVRKCTVKKLLDIIDDISILEFVDCKHVRVSRPVIPAKMLRDIVGVLIEVTGANDIVFTVVGLDFIKQLIDKFIEKLRFLTYSVEDDKVECRFGFKYINDLYEFLSWYDSFMTDSDGHNEDTDYLNKPGMEDLYKLYGDISTVPRNSYESGR